jgi:hypothetical protein
VFLVPGILRTLLQVDSKEMIMGQSPRVSFDPGAGGLYLPLTLALRLMHAIDFLLASGLALGRDISPIILMESHDCCIASQGIARVPSSSLSPTYHDHDASYMLPDKLHTMARHASLPHMHGKMFSTDGLKNVDGCDIKRTTSITSMRRRRSVTGMKRLLPLRLSPKLTSQDLPSHDSIRRATFGLPVVPSDGETIFERRHTFVPPPMTIRPEKYRDTPIYTEPGSPLLGRAYYTDDDACFACSPGSSCDENCIFNEYESSSDEASEGGDWFASLPEHFGEGGSGAASERKQSTTSDMSFKCREEPQDYATPLFRNEAAWLSSSSPPRAKGQPSNKNDEVSSPRRNSTWLDDTSSCDGDDEIVRPI